MPIAETKRWFEIAVPNPTPQNVSVQIGCHVEEFVEILLELEVSNLDVECYLSGVRLVLNKIADRLKRGQCKVTVAQRGMLLKELCDQIVTSVGIAHMLKMDIVSAMSEVNRSNFSKFVDGAPVFKEGGKIGKGPNYTGPDLSRFV